MSEPSERSRGRRLRPRLHLPYRSADATWRRRHRGESGTWPDLSRWGEAGGAAARRSAQRKRLALFDQQHSGGARGEEQQQLLVVNACSCDCTVKQHDDQ